MNMFGRPTIADLYRSNLDRAKTAIMSAPDDLIVETDTEDLVEYFSSQFRLTPISVDEGRQQEAVYKKRMQLIPAHQREEFYRDQGDKEFEYESIRLSVPFIHNEDIRQFAELSTSTRSLSWSIDQYAVSPDAITVDFDIKGYGFDHKREPSRVNQMLDEHKRRIAEWIGWVNADIARENPELTRQLTTFVNERKAKLEQDKQFIVELNKI